MSTSAVNDKDRLGSLIGRHIGVLQASFDSVAWIVAIVCATYARLNFNEDRVSWLGVSIILPIAILAQIDAGIFMGLYSGRWRFGSFEEVGALVRTVLVAASIIFLVDAFLLPGRAVPLSSVLIGAALAFLFMCFGRWWWRARTERISSFTGNRPNKLVIFGAGEAGYQALAAIRRDSNCGWEPVALVDDDPLKRNLRIFGVAVVGKSSEAERILRKYEANTLLIAAPSAPIEVFIVLNDTATRLK
ncbi:MAG: hypothetical protein HKL80_09520, partial [Acidimicrobiales bacterium]|nr:hypothetical protein [Acidimicrobiales bacterium]